MTTRLLLIVLLSLSSLANAATVYKDRFLPTGVCMVPFNGTQINAALIQDVTVGSWTEYIRNPNESWFSPVYVNSPPFTSLRVTLVNRQYYEIRIGDLRAAEAQLLKSIRDTCH